MSKEACRELKAIGKSEFFRNVIKKLTLGEELLQDQKSFVLASAILFIKQYEKDRRNITYADFAYYIILKYSLCSGDYTPLYDFSINFGFYPIARAVITNNLFEHDTIDNYIIDFSLDKFKNRKNYIETLEQYTERKNLLADATSERCLLAPTSFGKSSVIVDCIKGLPNGASKVVIVVPTKSLLVQTYQMIRDAKLDSKIIIHDEMYNNESSFIAIFTQERSLRLLNKKNGLSFDVIFVDEAHNILDKDSRSILLSRLLIRNRVLNPKQQVIYLSPLIEDIEKIKTKGVDFISSHKIKFNIKEPEIFEYRVDGKIFQYNRFVDEFYDTEKKAEDIFDYIKNNAQKKNFLYCYRPLKIEDLSKKLCNNLPEISVSKEIIELENILKREVHQDFYIIKCLKYGVIYLHGKMPDLIKEYLESKFKVIDDLKYVIANKVILEGINLPIDTLFVLNTYNLHVKELMNLIGRVNRLNTIFSANNIDLGKLLPKVHFVNSPEYNKVNSSMKDKIKLLRSRVFKDRVENPILESFDIDKLKLNKISKEKEAQKNESILRNEDFLNSIIGSERDGVKKYLIENGIADFYDKVDDLINNFLVESNNIKGGKIPDWKKKKMMEKIEILFIRNCGDIQDFEFSRLKNEEARNYYEYFITITQKKSLNENIKSQLNHFEQKILSTNKDDGLLYIGLSYGDTARPSKVYSHTENKVYIDLAKRSREDLVNIAIVKLKMEEDFVGFKLNKFIMMMYDYNLISLDEYNQYIYGTNDEKKISLTRYGLSVSLVTRLEKDGQLENLYFDKFNNLKGNEIFKLFEGSVDDFYKFEINRYLNFD